jgi:hypothetical protein
MINWIEDIAAEIQGEVWHDKVFKPYKDFNIVISQDGQAFTAVLVDEYGRRRTQAYTVYLESIDKLSRGDTDYISFLDCIDRFVKFIKSDAAKIN